MFEVVVATAFYSGLCYMVFEGTGETFYDLYMTAAFSSDQTRFACVPPDLRSIGSSQVAVGSSECHV